jgi:2-keto-4-pentenoate hydratase/2-oxohepta-3-ene-1,7-dioic acid hydratase in catechol pathway
MRLVVFDDYEVGVVRGDAVQPITHLVPGASPGDQDNFGHLVRAWDDVRPRIDDDAAPTSPLGSVQLHAPVGRLRHLLAAPVNYAAHIEEMIEQGFVDAGAHSAEVLGFFLKAPGAISGPADEVLLPLDRYVGRRFDHEGEIAFVVGRPCYRVSADEALDYVFGYTMAADITLRGTPQRTEERVMRKSFATFAPIGPWVTTADDVELATLEVQTSVNGELRQTARARELIVGIAELVEVASHVFPLEPGDVYLTGSPEGVGPVAPGDELVLSSGQLGTMRLPIGERKAEP